MGLQFDEVYVGTPEDRMANNHPDKAFADDEGHLTGGGFMGHAVGDLLHPRMPMALRWCGVV